MRRLKLKLLFSLLSEVDFLVKTEGFEYYSYDFLYFRLSEFEAGSIRDAASRLEKAGLIDKIQRGAQVYFRITANGRESFLRHLERSGGNRRIWDRTWRLAIISGQTRFFRKKLEILGYKRISRGVYITPFSVSEETKKLFLDEKYQGFGQVIESRRLIVGDDQQLAKKLWNLDLQVQKQLNFITFGSRLLKAGRRNFSLLSQSKGGFKDCFDRYFDLVLSDPGLPGKLLPPDWQFAEAKEIFLRLAVLVKQLGI